MHLETNKSEWSETKDKIRTRFGKLTDESIESVKGNLDLLKGKIQSAYGYAKEQAEKEYTSFKASLNETSNAATPMASATDKHADSKSTAAPVASATDKHADSKSTATPVASATDKHADSKSTATPPPVAAKSTTETAAPATAKVA